MLYNPVRCSLNIGITGPRESARPSITVERAASAAVSRDDCHACRPASFIACGGAFCRSWGSPISQEGEKNGPQISYEAAFTSEIRISAPFPFLARRRRNREPLGEAKRDAGWSEYFLNSITTFIPVRSIPHY